MEKLGKQNNIQSSKVTTSISYKLWARTSWDMEFSWDSSKRFKTFTPAHAEKTHIQTATFDHHNYKCLFFSLNTRKMTKSDYAAMILLWHVNYRDTQMWFHNFSTAVSAQHTTHASILFQNIKSHIFLLNFVASFQVQIWLNKTKPVTRCLQSGKKNQHKGKTKHRQLNNK